MSAPPEIIPAATLVLLRPADRGEPELLMIRRGANMRFAADAMVFPGGRIDPGDHVIAADPARVIGAPADPRDAAARVAAIRETIEETGIAAGILPSPDPAVLAAFRGALAAGEDFGALLAARGWMLDLERLLPIARWCPDMGRRVFDTRFYLAEAPGDAEAVVDGGESVHAVWASARALLAAASAGDHHMIFPTLRNLERLALFGSMDDARALVARYPVRRITPWVEERAGVQYLCIPEDQGYPVTSESLETARRAMIRD